MTTIATPAPDARNGGAQHWNITARALPGTATD